MDEPEPIDVTTRTDAQEPDAVERIGLEAGAMAQRAGQLYLDGEIDAARALYKEAADVMLRAVPLQARPARRDFVRLLAVANYFKGGFYDRAQQILDRIKTARMAVEFRDTVAKFKNELRGRTHKDYKKRIAKRFKLLASERRYQEILVLLTDHPYVFSAADTLRLRFRFANLAGLLSVDEIAKSMGIELAPLEQQAAETVAEAESAESNARFALPPGMRRSVMTGELEPIPPEESEPPVEVQDVMRNALFGNKTGP